MRLGKVILSVFFAVFFTVRTFGAKGDSEGNAVSVDFGSGTRKTVVLVAAYDSEDHSVDSQTGVYYFKSKLKRGQGYTIWTEGIVEPSPDETNRVTTTVSTYAKESDDDDEDGPSADFSEVEEPGANQRLILYYDDWYIDDEDKKESDPKSWTYYIVLEGNVGDEVTINFKQGAIIPQGREDNPQNISPTVNTATMTRNLQIGDEYYYRARLMAGRLYWFATSNGSDNNVLDISVISDAAPSTSEDSEEEDSSFDIYADPAFDDDPYNTGIYVVPDETGYFSIIVSGGDPATDDSDNSSSGSGALFGFSHRLFAERTIAAHAAVDLNAGNGFSAAFKPGHKNSSANMAQGYYDEIIDESLFRFTATKGARYVVETHGAQTNLLMRVYDAKGKILFENQGEGKTSNAKCAFEATASGEMFVGVCQNLLSEFSEEPAYTSATIELGDASVVDGSPDAWDPFDDTPAGATGLSPLPGTAAQLPKAVDTEGTGWHELNVTDWADVFMIGGRKGLVYSLSVSLEDPSKAYNTLSAEVFTVSGTREYPVSASGDINVGSSEPLTFTASANATYYIRLKVKEGQGLDFPKYKVHAMAYSTSGPALGILTVNTKGAAATWSIDRETVKYPGGASILVAGSHTVKFGTVKGYKVDAASVVVSVKAGKTPTVVTGTYSDTFDPKDDVAGGAASWSLKNTVTEMPRTLWVSDLEDNFSLSSKDGLYYDFSLRNEDGCDAVFSITNATPTAEHPDGVFVSGATSVSQLVLPAAKTKYYIVVRHLLSGEGAYTLSGFFANVGAIKFAKTAVSAKENAPSVAVTVDRTAKDGAVRVKYGTVAGTAVPGVDYVAQNGILEWDANDNKAKTINITLIPDLVPMWEGDKTFSVRIEPIPDEDRGAFEYPAQITGGDTCTVTLKEASKEGTTVESSYAAKAPKLATVKTEDVPLESGAYYGVLVEDGSALTNGFPRLASVSFSAAAKAPEKLSAKVTIAGKTYAFAATGWDEGYSEGTVAKTMELVQKVNSLDEKTGKTVPVVVTNTLTVTVAAGVTSVDGDWIAGPGEVELVMNVPDANNKGYQKGVVYRGEIFRDNSKIQDYLTAVTNFTGYYTVALVPDSSASDGVPAGNGYITLTIDNKGKAKAAGALADGTTKPSLSAVCALRKDDSSSSGWSLYVPVFVSKSPSCFGGVLRLYHNKDGVVVVDSGSELEWNNDNAALTYDNAEGWRIALTPVGGWYDTVISLQAYYLGCDFEVGTVDISEFPAESVSTGFELVTDVEPNTEPVSLSGDVFSTRKRILEKSGKLYDLASSVNPCNVQVKFTRATGLVSGSFSLWSASTDGTKQKEITGIKHAGVAILAREDSAPLDTDAVSAGFFTQQVTLTDKDPNTGRTKTRKWNFSAPFNIMGFDQGAIDWWADDWGTEP